MSRSQREHLTDRIRSGESDPKPPSGLAGGSSRARMLTVRFQVELLHSSASSMTNGNPGTAAHVSSFHVL
nr:hypothetical protein CFP56_64834 [Quercus suber]